MNRVTELRRELHRHPELAGSEGSTAERIARFFLPLEPDLTLKALGGHGLAFVFAGSEPGPTVLLRCDLDALPIGEVNDFAHQSTVPGVSHKCGHDGHMAIMAAVGLALAAERPRIGRAVLLFQPAEETGQGARAVIDDERFARIKPDHVFALHNLPGFAPGEIIVRPGVFCCASSGLDIRLEGTTAHAAQPETGRSPTSAMCGIIAELEHLAARFDLEDEPALATVVGANLGGRGAFGTAPGVARIMATIRAESDATLARMLAQVEEFVGRLASDHDLEWEIAQVEEFPATVNSAVGTEIVRRAAGDSPTRQIEKPFRWSEDFGHFTAMFDGALFGLGAGEDTPDLHHPAYDFPDTLIEPGRDVLLGIVRDILS